MHLDRVLALDAPTCFKELGLLAGSIFIKKILLIVVLLSLAGQVAAGDKPEWRSWPVGDRLTVSAGVFFPQLDTKVRARSADAAFPVASIVDFEDDLGLDDTANRPMGSVNWRISKRNSIELSYFEVNRSGRTTSSVPILFGDNIISVGTPVVSYFNVEVLEAHYAYSIIFRERLDWSVGVGLSLQKMDMGIIENPDSPLNVDPEEFSFVAPMPTLNTRLRYAFTDKWLGSITLGWLAVEAELSDSTDFSGSVWNSSAGIRYKAFKNVGFNFLWNVFYVDMEYKKRDLDSEVDYSYSGPVLAIEAYF
jgi:hypothetical protein